MAGQDTSFSASTADAGIGTDGPEKVRAYVVHPDVRQTGARPEADGPAREKRSPEASLEEAVGLALAIDLDVVRSDVVPVPRVRPATLFGTGKVEDLKTVVLAEEIDLVVVDGPVTPGQQRNLERAWKTKVLDRTGLILEIFGERARTREGRLQVELAHLNYQKSRLVRTWTHLERQRGGLGFVGGPGETQIEADRRMIQERITKLERQLETVTRTRQLHRSSRQKVPYQIVALVGYTNAGKSTLFNRLTSSDVFAKDLLFATLDPTMRAIALPSGRKVILSDTVGFISDLPTHLVAAFRATLEEVLEADLILHVRDISHEDTGAQLDDVNAVLAMLGIAEDRRDQVLEVWNKIDRLEGEARHNVLNQATRDEAVVPLSAVTGEGVDALLETIEQRLAARSVEVEVTVDAADGAGINWLYENCDIRERVDSEGEVMFRLRAEDDKLSRLEKRFGPVVPVSEIRQSA